MLKAIIKKKSDDALKDLALHLLKNGHIGGVFSLKRFKSSDTVDYGLITDPGLLEFIEPFYPVMPFNAGQTLSKFTKMEKPVLAVIRPCEFRGFVEMLKREQGCRQNFIILTSSCGGVIPLKKHKQDNIDRILKQYSESLKAGKNSPDIRDSCKRCEYFYPENADIIVRTIEAGDSETEMFINSNTVADLLKGSNVKLTKGEFDTSILKELTGERKTEKKKQYAEIDKSDKGLDGMVEIFGRCIGCRGCNSVCPICYCTHCDFASSNFDYNKKILEKEMYDKGALRLPPDTMFFHIGRMSHMAFSCVGCGQCSDVCPAEIPVGTVFNRAGEQVASEFDFIPGRSEDEDIPVMIYKEQEFPELGE